MSANLLRSLVDDDPGFHKQREHRTGISLHFDHQYLGKVGQNSQKRLPLVYPNFSSSNNLHAPGLYTRRDVDDKQRISAESPGASYSSACLSSFSSPNSSQMEQIEVSTLDQIILPDISSSNTSKKYSGAHFQDLSEDSKRDSVRSFWLEEPINRPSKIKESLSVLDRSREAPSYFDKCGEVLQLSYESANLAPRLSYDGGEPGRLSFESQDTIVKLKNLPRLSLDSREQAMLHSNSMLKLQENDLLENSRSSKGGVNYMIKSRGTQKRPPNVVAKLMGLEAFPDPVRPIKNSDSAGRPKMEAVSSSWKLHDSAMKSVSGSKFLIESAPWKQQKGTNEEPQKSMGSNTVKVPTRQAARFSPVYGETERRLKELELNQSGKDLRALKQILETMRANGFLDSERGEECLTNSKNQEKYNMKYVSLDQNLEFARNCNPRSSNVFYSAEQESDHLRSIEPTIVIMKPAALVGDVGTGTGTLNSRVVNNDGTAKDQSPKSSSRVSPCYVDKRRNGQGLVSKECSVNPVKSAGSLSPKLQRSRLELEKKHPSTRQSCEQKIKSGGKRGTDSPKFSSSLGNNTFHQTKLHSNINYQSLSLKSSRQKTQTINEEDGPSMEEAISGLVQHPSPVSVLDMSESPDDSPSPVQDTRNSLGECSDHRREIQDEPRSSLGFNHRKLQNIERLVQKLKRLNSTHDEESIDYIALLCENPNPRQRYISEILVASGFLLLDLSSGLSTFQLHPSGHPINPDVFLVLEHRKTRNGMFRKEDKSCRRLTFDAVNEILAGKLAGTGILRDKLVKETLTAQNLLKELCCEIELLEAKAKNSRGDSDVEEDGCLRSILREDVMRSKEQWIGSCGETYDLVRELEQMILEGLLDEIEVGRKVSSRTGSSKSSRQHRKVASSK